MTPLAFHGEPFYIPVVEAEHPFRDNLLRNNVTQSAASGVLDTGFAFEMA